VHIFIVILVTISKSLKTIFVNSVGFHGKRLFENPKAKKLPSFSDRILLKILLNNLQILQFK